MLKTFCLLGLMLMMAKTNSAQTAFINAAIYDGENYLLNANAFIVENGHFVKIGRVDELTPFIAPKSAIIDLKGARVVPGFIESHAHLLGLGQSKINLDLRNKQLSDVLTLLKQHALTQPAGSWIQGRNWDQNLWPKFAFPTADLLKGVSSSHPIYLKRVDGHAAWVNEVALKKARIDRMTPDPQGGQIIRDASGNATGILIDKAMDLVGSVVDKPSPKELDLYLQLGQQEALSFGITSIHDAGVGEETLALYEKLARASKLRLRIYAMIDGENLALVEKYFALGPQRINDFLTIRSIKYFADGALGSRGALLIDDYADKPRAKGLALIDEKDLAAKVLRALEHGFQVATHAIGDQANRMVLNAYEQALKQQSSVDARLRIEHAQLVDPSDHARFNRLRIIASMQPVHCTSDMTWVPHRLGAARLPGRAYPWRSLLNHDVILAFGSDAPVESINPLEGIFAAVTRQHGRSEANMPFMPEERLTLKEALRGFFKNAAFAEYSEEKKGRIAEGFLADFVVFDQDILNLPKSAFLKARPRMTVVGGLIAYERP